MCVCVCVSLTHTHTRLWTSLSSDQRLCFKPWWRSCDQWCPSPWPEHYGMCIWSDRRVPRQRFHRDLILENCKQPKINPSINSAVRPNLTVSNTHTHYNTKHTLTCICGSWGRCIECVCVCVCVCLRSAQPSVLPLICEVVSRTSGVSCIY